MGVGARPRCRAHGLRQPLHDAHALKDIFEEQMGGEMDEAFLNELAAFERQVAGGGDRPLAYIREIPFALSLSKGEWRTAEISNL